MWDPPPVASSTASCPDHRVHGLIESAAARERVPRLTPPACLLAVCSLIAAAGPAAAAPRDFTPDVKALFAVAACGDAVPAGYDATTVAAHCKELGKSTASWKTHWRDKAAPFFQDLLGGKYPSTIVYPFGGGDLSTLLVVYPDATEYTTLSLEGMGDPRPLAGLASTGAGAAKQAKKLAAELAKLRGLVKPNLGWAWNTTIQLSIESSETGAGLPGILTLALVALDANGYEPIEARFFTLGENGAIVYLEQSDVDAYDAAAPVPGKHKATNSVQQSAFNDVEIVFRKKGDPNATRKTFRHIAGDLSDDALAKVSGPLDHLAQKHDIAAMTKAASYLLWRDGFSKIRDYLLGNMKHMVSDDTGIPPRFSRPAGFTTELWGSYAGPYFEWARGPVATEMVQLFKGNSRPQPFRFGYYDRATHAVLMYVHK
jgi:hypothetical protein